MWPRACPRRAGDRIRGRLYVRAAQTGILPADVSISPGQLTLMPPTGSPRIAMALASPSASARRIGVRHPDGETDRRSRRRGRAAGTPARTVRMPPMSSIWIPGPEMGTSPGSSSGLEPGRRPNPGTPQRSRPPRPRPPGRRRMRLPGTSASLFRRNAERRGRVRENARGSAALSGSGRPELGRWLRPDQVDMLRSARPWFPGTVAKVCNTDLVPPGSLVPRTA